MSEKEHTVFLQPSPEDISHIIGKLEKLKIQKRKLETIPLDFPKNPKNSKELLAVEMLARASVKQDIPQQCRQIPKDLSSDEVEVLVSELSEKRRRTIPWLIQKRLINLSVEALKKLLNKKIPEMRGKIPLREEVGVDGEIFPPEYETLDTISKDTEAELQRKIEDAKKARWEKNIKPLIDNIEIDLAPYQPYLLTSYKLGHTGIINQSLYADDPKTLDPVVLEFKKLKRTREKELEAKKLKGTSKAKSGETGGGCEEQIYTEMDLAGRKQQSEKTLPELIAQGESHTLEFKETFEYDIRQKQKNDDILKSTLKTIAAFLNADGGTLLIGVSDSGQLEGLQRDFSLLPAAQRNNDKFELRIRNYLQGRFQPSPIGKIKISFEKLEEKTICKVDVEKSREIHHLDGEVYVREGNKTQKLEGRDLTDWIQERSK
jgi:hypothetical protein